MCRNREARKPSTSHGSTLLDRVHSQLTPFAFKKFNMQYQQEAYYTVTSFADGWLVQRNQAVGDMIEGDTMNADVTEDDLYESLGDIDIDEGLDVESSMTKWFVSCNGDCNCQYKLSMGISCRHVIAVSTLLYKQKLLSHPSGILGGPAISYWLASKQAIVVPKPAPRFVVALKVSVALIFTYNT